MACDASGTAFQVQLNDFQRLMLYWNESLPFHVTDIVEVKCIVDPANLQHAAEQELLSTGIASPQVDIARGICTYRPEPCKVETVTVASLPGVPILQVLQQHATAELRRPFQLNVDPLIRLWLVPHAAHTYVGMTWQHWCGDGMAAGDLLHRILARALGWTVPKEVTLCDWRGVDEQQAFAPWFTWRRKLRHAWEAVSTIGTSALVAQLPRPRGPMPAPTAHFLELPADVLGRLRRIGKPMDATVNDVLVAVAARALSTVLPPPGRLGRLRRLRVGNIVDLRPSGGEILRGKGGVYLGLTNVDCPPVLPERWEDLIAIVRRRSQRSKQGRYYFATLGGFRFSRKLWPWVPPTWRRTIYTNILRLTGVLSNLRYPPIWYAGPAASQVGACWRALPLGFMYPLVLGITTLGDQLTMTLTCDATGPIADRAELLKDQIQRDLAGF